MADPARPTLVCVDFDDTLVASQVHFDEALDAFAALLRREHGVPEDRVRQAFREVDARHHHLGRHRNRFLLTLLFTYAELTGEPRVPLRLLPEVSAIAAHPYDAPVEPRPGVPEALRRLRDRLGCRLWLVTAGDRVVQHGRIQRAGLAGEFDAVHVVAEKTAELFQSLRRGHRHAVMIGNSPRTDLWPALAAGFRAIHVQAPTWVLDDGPLPTGVPSCPSFPHAVEVLLSSGA